MLQAGTLVDKRYEVLEPLGRGGMGAVYRVRHVHLGHDFALKELLNASPEAEAQFRQEARLLAGLQHPHLPRVTDYFSAKGRNYLVMDHVPGSDLQALLDGRQAPFGPGEVTAWTRQLLAALGYVHANHVVHRDIKPANLKLTPEGKLVLVDFGIAKGGERQPARTGFHAHHAYTPHFAAPEQVIGHGTGPRTDLFAVGATATYLLTAELPPRPAAVPGPLGQALARAMAPDPAGRFADAAAFAAALGPGVAAPASPGTTGRRDIRR